MTTLCSLRVDLMALGPFEVVKAIRAILELIGWFWSIIVSIKPIVWFLSQLMLVDNLMLL